MSVPPPRIWIITHPDHPDGPIAPLRKALAGNPGGGVGVQLRAKRVSDRQLIAWGHELRAITAAAGCVLAINRRPDVAQIVDADAVHLPERALPVDEIRQQWPSLRWIGVSRHSRAGLRDAAARDADYAFLSPVFQVPQKGAPLGLTAFRDAIAHVGIPTYALGGVTARDAEALVQAGAFGVAVRRAIYDASAPRETLQALIDALDKNDLAGE